jgi:TRAP-type mannitol/chloroaromatic compound transport system substrate-binding protein
VGEKYQWRYQSTANAGTATYWTEEEFVSVMNKASGGRLVFDLQPQGSIVGTNEIFDAVSTGAIEVGSS